MSLRKHAMQRLFPGHKTDALEDRLDEDGNGHQAEHRLADRRIVGRGTKLDERLRGWVFEIVKHTPCLLEGTRLGFEHGFDHRRLLVYAVEGDRLFDGLLEQVVLLRNLPAGECVFLRC